HRCSSRYLRISPLHREFHAPLPYSSTTVSPAGSELSPEISQVTCGTAYAPFTPNGVSSSTLRRCVRVPPIAQNSPLLPPVGVWTVFQFKCGRAPSQAGYRSLPWWAITPPTS